MVLNFSGTIFCTVFAYKENVSMWSHVWPFDPSLNIKVPHEHFYGVRIV